MTVSEFIALKKSLPNAVNRSRFNGIKSETADIDKVQ